MVTTFLFVKNFLLDQVSLEFFLIYFADDFLLLILELAGSILEQDSFFLMNYIKATVVHSFRFFF